jgi:hypothetical protein
LVTESSVLLLRRDARSILLFFSIALSFTLGELQSVFDKRVSFTMIIRRPRTVVEARVPSSVLNDSGTGRSRRASRRRMNRSGASTLGETMNLERKCGRQDQPRTASPPRALSEARPHVGDPIAGPARSLLGGLS